MPETAALMPLSVSETASLADRVYDRLRQAIIAGDLASGQPVSERSLAGTLGVSVAPVRDALQRLERDGLVVSSPRRATVVADFSRERLREMGLIRVALEAAAAAIAATKATSADIEALSAQLEVMRRASDAAQTKRLAEANERFHAMLHAIADNGFLTQALHALRGYEMIGRFRALTSAGEPARALREHADVVAALRRNDADAAEACMRAHALRSLEYAFRDPPEQKRKS
jgi:DNA-binding GntR family transcriptional regulator